MIRKLTSSKRAAPDDDQASEDFGGPSTHRNVRPRIASSQSQDDDEYESSKRGEDYIALSDGYHSDASSDVFIKTRLYPDEIQAEVTAIYDRLLPAKTASDPTTSTITSNEIALALKASSVIDPKRLERLAAAIVKSDHDTLQSLIPGVGKRLNRFRAPQQIDILKRINKFVEKTLPDATGGSDLTQALRAPVLLLNQSSENSSVHAYKTAAVKRLTSRHAGVADLIASARESATNEGSTPERSTAERLDALSTSVRASDCRVLEKIVDKQVRALRRLAKEPEPLFSSHADVIIMEAVQLHHSVNGGEYRPAPSKSAKRRYKGHTTNVAEDQAEANAHIADPELQTAFPANVVEGEGHSQHRARSRSRSR